MNCPFCNDVNTKVIDSRHLQNGLVVRRRRSCSNCSKRYTTHERLQFKMPIVRKNDKRRESYSREKINRGINKACHKRSIKTYQISKMIDEIEQQISNNYPIEVTSKIIGKIVMEKVYQMDIVAYVRFVSFYWNFEDINDFVNNLNKKSWDTKEKAFE